jgi:kumamolisin
MDRLVPLALSERHLPAGAEVAGDINPDEKLGVTVYVRPRPGHPELPDPETIDPLQAQPVSDEDFASAYGADQADIDKVVRFARRHKLTVKDSDPLKRSVMLEGSAASLQAAFGVQLKRYRRGAEEFRGRVGPVNVPEDLHDVIESVFGLDDRRVGQPRLRRSWRLPSRVTLSTAHATGLPPNTYLPPAVANMYRFPPGTDGSGECVAILNFNEPDNHGGYSAEALAVYFEQVLGIPVPDISDVVVHGQGNDPGSDDGSDPWDTSGEVMLDVQMVGGCAPKAKIIMYFTQFTEQGWVDAINAIITDTANRPTVISVSYGNPEDDPRSAWTAAAIQKVNEAFRAAAARGITICCAAGDDGSRDQAGDGFAHADFPASSPYVLGCGGTRVIAPNGVIVQEVVWNDGPGSATGGGVSKLFPLPSYQRFAGVPPSVNPDHRTGRGVPDVSGVADPETGVVIMTLDGQHLAVIGGTSATAPMWSALIARLNQAVQRPLGFANPTIYRLLHYGVLRDITQGTNGAYHAGPGWDACTGVGSPDGVNLLAAISWLISLAAARGAGTQTQPDAAGAGDGGDGYLRLIDDSLSAYALQLYRAWTKAASAVQEQSMETLVNQFGGEVQAALFDYLNAQREAWSQVGSAEQLDPGAMWKLANTMTSAGTLTTLALSGAPVGPLLAPYLPPE